MYIARANPTSLWSSIFLWRENYQVLNNDILLVIIIFRWAPYWRYVWVYFTHNILFFFYRKFECVPDVWSLSEWSNWLTPASLSKRFDTMFYLCFLDNEPTVLHDEKEMTHSKVIDSNGKVILSMNVLTIDCHKLYKCFLSL